METKTPVQILEYTQEISTVRANRGILQIAVLGFLAGAFIAFACGGSNMAAFNLLANPDTLGLGRTLAGAVFGVGLMLVIVAGGELFTGNTLMIVAVLDKKITVWQMFKNWIIVYFANFVGSVFIAYMMNKSMLFDSGNYLLGGQTIKIAAYKTSLSFEAAFFLGIMCNWLVCLAVWVSFASNELSGKLLACFFIIGLFVISGFEHCVANMYYIPAGIMAKSNENWAFASNISAEQLQNLNWYSYWIKNQIPVVLGNIIGGAFFVGTAYRFGLKKR